MAHDHQQTDADYARVVAEAEKENSTIMKAIPRAGANTRLEQREVTVTPKPGDFVTYYEVTENSDKMEGRGGTIRTAYFWDRDLAVAWGQGRGPMGGNERPREHRVVVGSDGLVYSADNGITLPEMQDGRIKAVLAKLTPEEQELLKKYMR